MPLKGKVTEDAITDLLKSEKLPAVIEFNDKNSQKIFSAGIEKQVRVCHVSQGNAGIAYSSASP